MYKSVHKLLNRYNCVFVDTVNALTADGLKFAHPLQHLGKSTKDLPLIAIDSFKHMYLFKEDVKSKLGFVMHFIGSSSV